MGNLPTSPASFIPNTRARANEVNAKFAEHSTALKGGDRDIYTNGYRLNRLGVAGVNVTLTGADCIMLAYFNVGTGNTYDLSTSTARLTCIGELEVPATSTLDIAPGAIAVIL